MNLKISTKIIITLTIAIAGMAIIGLTSYFGISKIGKELVEISDYQMPIKNATIELEKDILKEEILAFALFTESSNTQGEKFKNIVDEIHIFEDKTKKAILDAEKLVEKAIEHASTQKAKKSYENFMKELKVLEKEQKKVKELFKILLIKLENGNLKDLKEDKVALIAELKLMDNNITKLLNELTTLLNNSTQMAKSDEEMILLIIEIVSVIALIISIISAIILIKFFNSSVTNFKDGLKEFFKFLNHEITSVQPIAIKVEDDEIGQMTQSVNRYIDKSKTIIEEDKEFINSVKNIIEEIKNGKLTSKIELNPTKENLKDLKDSFNTMMNILEQNIGKDTNTILQVLDKLANMDFDCSISDAKGKIEISVNSVIDLINIMLSENKSNGLALDNSAKQLLGNVNKLSASSNEAAASLEETAAALEEITSTVQVTTQKVSEMSSLAEEVTTATNKGEQLASNTTNAMEEINTQVSTINEAITVIDQIAFQTNILSLNAAVEAATAGEAGKGFAVVAQEVRNLASRSAEAAKEIKDIVELANAKANEGKNIANEMSNGYYELNQNILKTIELIKDVTTASKEQQGGLEQINNAVNLLDRQTQENAMIATQTQDISNETSSIAKEVLEDVDKKNFKGKNTISAKKISSSNIVETPVTASTPIAKTQPAKVNTKAPTNNTQKEIISQSNDDEWESF